MDKPEGLIVHHVLDEVAALTDPKTGALLYEGVDPDGSKNFDKIANGGLKIVTTIDQKLQQAAVQEASRNPESRINKSAGQPAGRPRGGRAGHRRGQGLLRRRQRQRRRLRRLLQRPGAQQRRGQLLRRPPAGLDVEGLHARDRV